MVWNFQFVKNPLQRLPKSPLQITKYTKKTHSTIITKKNKKYSTKLKFTKYLQIANYN